MEQSLRAVYFWKEGLGGKFLGGNKMNSENMTGMCVWRKYMYMHVCIYACLHTLYMFPTFEGSENHAAFMGNMTTLSQLLIKGNKF